MAAAAAVYLPRAFYSCAIVRDAPKRTSDARLPSSGAKGPATSDWNEATLSVLWAGQRFPASAAVTVAGAPLRVIHPGFPGRGAGPDFRDALITGPGNETLRGDVELHVRASDFAGHGHDRDRRYNRVVLHVVLDAEGRTETELASGRRVPVVALGAWAGKRADELAGWLRSPSLWREPCHDAVARLGVEEAARRIDAMGEARLAVRVQALADDIEGLGAGEALWRALLAVAGYGGARASFAAVAEALPAEELVGRVRCVAAEKQLALAEGMLLSAAKALQATPSGAGGSRPTANGGAAVQIERGAGGRRPVNTPERRLAGLARLAVRHVSLLAGEALPDALDGRPAALIAQWTVAAEGRWRGQRSAGALIGRGRAIELLTNAVLPWASALGDDRAGALLARLPAPGRYGALAFLEANLRHDGKRLPLTALRQQGLLALYKTECTQGGCGRCPLS